MSEPVSWLPPPVQRSYRTTNRRTLSQPVWPGGARCCVSLSIHVDAQTVWRALGMEKLVYISQGEYGARTAVWRVLDVLERRGITASFFIPGWTAENYPEIVRSASAAGHEIGHHSYSHTLADMGLGPDGQWDRAVEEREFDRALRVLRDLSGQPIRGYVPPSGELSPHTVDILLTRGFLYQSQCSADDIPYWWYVGGKPCDLIEVPTHWSQDDAPHFLYTLIPQMGFIKGPDEVFGIWKREFDAFRHFGRCLVLQMHPQWIGRPSRIRMLDELLTYMRGFDDVWWATGIEIAEYWRDRYPPERSQPAG